MIDSARDLGPNPNKPKSLENGGAKESKLKSLGSSQENVVSQSEVQLSDDATKLDALARGLSDLPEVNVEKVEAIKAQIEKGEYKIDIENLAQRIQDSFADGQS